MLAVLTCDAPVAPEVRWAPAAVQAFGTVLRQMRADACDPVCSPPSPNWRLQVWRGMFKRGAINSFNQITVDGDTSTNDTVIGLASGLAGGAGGWAGGWWVGGREGVW